MGFEFEDTPRTRRDLPKLERGVPFLLAHPGGWSVYEGKILPSLVRYSLRGGLHRVTDADLRMPDGKSNPHPAIAKVRAVMDKRDHTYLPWDDRLNDETYLEAHEVFGGGKVYLPVWERPIPGSTRTKVDLDVYARWVAHWQDRGLIPKTPPEAIVAERKNSARRNVDRTRERPGGDKSERFRAATATLKAWESTQAAPSAKKAAKKTSSPFDDANDGAVDPLTPRNEAGDGFGG
jgi:hypothetical protein